ncbi:uncharacterized protein LOC127811149 [Diospyros lotus]|uniref:uncharacterized protein LOC127811149 n=1 Tax=Diospyros lotus TaxID=55363 RepID=UPI002258BB63|nr:uncharacterized protein LOC127811149 [Diospyros lotus]
MVEALAAATEREQKEWLGRENFGRPNPIRTLDKFRNKDKFCAYHNEARHNTSECWALKDAIKEQIRKGRLHDYVVRSRDQQPQHPVQPEPRQAPKQDLAPVVRTIFTIHGGPHIAGTFNRSHEHYVWEASHLLLAGYGEQGMPSKKAKATPSDIVFSEEDTREVHWPHNDVLVVRARIGKVEVRRIMVDTGSSVNLLYRGCFDQMVLGSDQPMASPESLYGFTGDTVTPAGCIRLPLIIGDSDRQATIMTDFLIID